MGLFRLIFGAKKPGSSRPSKEKRRWSFAGRSSNKTPSHSNFCDTSSSLDGDNFDASKHAIAVAAATAAVAEAALAAAQAAAEVVRLTSGGGRSTAQTPPNGSYRRLAEETAAVKIQSAFRGYLARRALRALKALVKLQALVRGHIVRKQTADMFRRMQTLVRLQTRARANRANVLETWNSSSHSSNSRFTVPSPQRDNLVRAYSTKFDGPSVFKRCGSNSNFRDVIDLDKSKLGSNWLDRWMEENLWNNHSNPSLRNQHIDDEKSDKILEVDTWVPHMTSQRSSICFQSSSHNVLASDRNNQIYMTFDSPSKLSTKTPNPMSSISSREVLAFNSLKTGEDEAAFSSRTAENSPNVVSASSRPGSSCRRGGAFMPTRSEQSWGYFNGYSGYPNYMANTESFQAKVRSQSAPRQRLEFDRHGSSKRLVQGLYDMDTCSESGFIQHTEFRNTAHPASSRLNRIGSNNFR